MNNVLIIGLCVFGVLLVAIGIGVSVGFSLAKSGNAFRDNSRKICEGMTKEEVVKIMGEPSFKKTHQDGSYELVYEKNEWKGLARGGTITRKMEVVISSEDTVISVGRNKDCDRSGW